MNYTVRPTFLSHKANSEGISSIRIAVTVDRKISYHATSHRIHLTQWDAKKRVVINHPNAALINIDLKREVAKIEENVLHSKLQGVKISKSIIKGEKKAIVTFAKYSAEVRRCDKEVNRLETFAGAGVLISDIDVAFLRKYEANERRRGMSPNTVNSTFKYLRRILNQAEAERIIRESPFRLYSVPRYQQTDRLYLVEADLTKFVNLLNDNLPEDLYRTLCYFLLGCYSGLRHSDWVRFNHKTMVSGNLLKLRAKKNKNLVVLPIGPTLRGIINRIKDLPPPFSNQKCNEKLKALSVIANVNKKVTTHTGRHSFGYLCASNELPKSVTAELLGVNTKTVEVYYHLSGSNIRRQAAVLEKL